ncbi:MAG: acyl-CoA thioesterase [Desulfobacterales bacterium]|nr:acyl-CoA thioesterase [Desulfobacterales bacterium]
MREPVHRSFCRVLYGDTDAAGVVYYGNYLRYFESGRSEFMRDQVCSYREIEERGLVLPVIACHARYKAPARYDDLLAIDTSLTEITRVRCRFSYRIIRTATRQQPEQSLVKGYTEHAVINRHGKLTKLPADIYQPLREMLEQPDNLAAPP